MQGMLSAFQGLVVDWRRGKVSARGGGWGAMVVTQSFWRDLEWWAVHLRKRCLTPFKCEDKLGEAVLSGTDGFARHGDALF